MSYFTVSALDDTYLQVPKIFTESDTVKMKLTWFLLYLFVVAWLLIQEGIETCF